MWAIPVDAAPAVLAPTAATAQSGVFSGTWTSTDSDESSQQVVIRGSGNGSYSVFLVDTSATVCDRSPAAFVGSGVADGDTLVVFGTLVCLPGGNIFRHRIAFEFDYSAANDTLTDGTGVVWDRS